MTPADFEFLRDMLKDRSGLVVTEDKQYLLESRLMPLARKSGMPTLVELVAALRAPDSEQLRKDATEAMTINESFFFRDKTPFENFENVIAPALIESRAASRRLRIWCAAASTGQEPYSLAMQVREMSAQLGSWNVEIFGTDLSGEVLEKAKAGLYSQFEVQRGMPIQMLVKYFKQNGNLWQIDSAIRSMVRYEQFNLLDDFSRFGTVDVVFCRNVLIYFDPDTKRDILNRIAKRLAPDGYLILGAAETVIGITDQFKPVAGSRGLYEMASADARQTPAVPAPSATAFAASAAAARPATTAIGASAAAAVPAIGARAASPAVTAPAASAPAASAAKPAATAFGASTAATTPAIGAAPATSTTTAKPATTAFGGSAAAAAPAVSAPAANPAATAPAISAPATSTVATTAPVTGGPAAPASPTAPSYGQNSQDKPAGSEPKPLLRTTGTGV